MSFFFDKLSAGAVWLRRKNRDGDSPRGARAYQWAREDLFRYLMKARQGIAVVDRFLILVQCSAEILGVPPEGVAPEAQEFHRRVQKFFNWWIPVFGGFIDDVMGIFQASTQIHRAGPGDLNSLDQALQVFLQPIKTREESARLFKKAIDDVNSGAPPPGFIEMLKELLGSKADGVKILSLEKGKCDTCPPDTKAACEIFNPPKDQMS